jgi:hypothetical protein
MQRMGEGGTNKAIPTLDPRKPFVKTHINAVNKVYAILVWLISFPLLADADGPPLLSKRPAVS